MFFVHYSYKNIPETQLKEREIIDLNLHNDNLDRPVHFLMAILHYFKRCDMCIMFMLRNYCVFYLNVFLNIFVTVTFIKFL